MLCSQEEIFFAVVPPALNSHANAYETSSCVTLDKLGLQLASGFFILDNCYCWRGYSYFRKHSSNIGATKVLLGKSCHSAAILATPRKAQRDQTPI